MRKAANEKIVDGLIKQNIVLVSGLVLAPVIAAATDLYKALLICLAFSLISFFTIALCRIVPRKIAYTLRVILYAVVASVVYIPVMIICENIFAENVIASVGIYIPIMVTNSLILSKTETRFYLSSFGHMVADSLLFILGFDAVCILVGAIRDILVNGKIGRMYLDMPFSVPALETTFGGFILVGIMAGTLRAATSRIYGRKRREKNRAALDAAVLEAVNADIDNLADIDEEGAFDFIPADNSHILEGIQALVDDANADASENTDGTAEENTKSSENPADNGGEAEEENKASENNDGEADK